MNYECKTIPGYEDYQVDTNGNLWSLKFGKKKLKPSINQSGYFQVALIKSGKIKSYLLHRLIMLTFHNESDLSVNHIDGVKTNNNLTNLEYCTPLENVRHAMELGLMNHKGENHPKSKLTKKDVIEIKKELLFYYDGLSTKLAKQYKVTPSAIYKIRKGKSWAHVKIN